MATNSGPADDAVEEVIQVESADEFEQLVAGDERVLVDFYADWCGACQRIAGTVEDLAADSENPVVKLDVEELPELTASYDVEAVPTVIVFQRGLPVERFRGVTERSTLAAALEG
jgi:thioredoxin 1